MKLNRVSKIQCLIAMSLLPCMAQAVDNSLKTSDKSDADKLVMQEESIREAMLKDLWAQRSEIIKLEENKHFTEADAAYQALIKQLGSIPGVVAKDYSDTLVKSREKMKKDWIKDIVSKAKDLASTGQYEDAIILASTVSAVDEVKGPQYVEGLIKDWSKYIQGKSYKIASDISDPDWEKYPVVSNQRLDDEEQAKVISFMNKAEEHLAKEEYELAAEAAMEVLNFDTHNTRASKILERTQTPRIESLLYSASTYYKNKKYAECIKALEKVYIIDPYNIKATTMLERAYRKVFSYASLRHKADSQSLSAMGTWAWIEPIRVESQDPMSMRKAEVKLTKSAIFDKMDRIVFPKFALTDASIFDIVTELSRRSKMIDPDKVGVDIVIQASDVEKKTNPKFSKKTSFSVANMPLSDILRYVTSNFGLKYKADENTIVVGDNIDDKILKTFIVRNDLIDSIVNDSTTASSLAFSEGDSGDGLDTGAVADAAPEEGEAVAAGSIAAKSAKMKAYFALRGVKFPEGSSIVYSNRTNTLSVKNSEENLLKLGELLDQLMVIQTPMIMTEVKFIEITDSNYEELGFDWDFSLVSNSQTSPWSFEINSDNLRFEESTELIKNINIFPKMDNKIFGATPNLSLTVHAISKDGRSESLSTPRLIAKSGETASIKMVTTTRYPDSWEAPDISNSSDNTSTISFPVPELGEDDETGIILTVTPAVAADNRTITLDLHPQVVTVVTEGADSTYVVSIEEGTVVNNQMVPTTTNNFNVWMPEFGYKTLDVKLKVYDGETIVLGGVTQNKVERRNDRIPILGDIPLLGRLFQERMEKATQINFLIFVTARLINHTGRPVNPMENTATPNFNY